MMDRHPTTHSLRAGASAHGLRVLDGGASAQDRVTEDAAWVERHRLLEELDAARALCDLLDDAGLRVAFGPAADEAGVMVKLVEGGGPEIRTLSLRDVIELDWLSDIADVRVPLSGLTQLPTPPEGPQAA